MQRLKLGLWMEKLKLNLLIHNLFFLCLLTTFVGCGAHATREPESEKTVIQSENFDIKISYPKEGVIEGAVFLMTVESSKKIDEISAKFKEKSIAFFEEKTDAGHKYSSYVGTEFGTSIGTSDFTLKTCIDKNCTDQKLSLNVLKGKFPSEKLTVPPRSVEPTKADLKIIAEDNKFLAKAYANSVNEKLWDKPIILPVEKEITSVYGSNRVYNGKMASSHLGTDFRAPTGTPIYAPLAGKVVCAHKLFFTGYTVIIDHGFNFFTIYGHMSKLKVKEGQTVSKKDELGLSGATGRASGPHLHWGVKLHGMKVDPMSFVSLLK